MDYISKIEGHPLKADGLTESPRLLDKEPYLFRPSFSNGYAYETLIGGTVAWNQLADNTSATVTAGANQNINFNSTKYGIVSGHKYLISCRQNTTLTSIERNTFVVRDDDNSQNYYQNTTSNYHLSAGTYYWVYNATFTSGGFFRMWCNNPNADVTYDNFQVFDLTAMFGSTIADYIYGLEQATAGAGVAWFRKYYPKVYYPYNAGQLLSVKAIQHNTVGFNQWDEQWELGYINYSNGQESASNSDLRSKNYCAIPSNATLYLYANGMGSGDDWKIILYDKNKNYLDYWGFNPNGRTIDTANACFFKICLRNKTTYNHDICINISDANRNGTYEPYSKHEYNLDSDLELRGIPKLDSNNNLYYDGDTYESNGNVTRKYGIVDLGSLDWLESGGNFFCQNAVSNRKPNAYAICGGYTQVAETTPSGLTVDRTFAFQENVITRVSFRDTRYTTTEDFKTAMSGKYLVYELATPTTETADHFTNPMQVDGNGTEEFVDGRAVEIPVGHETIYIDNSDKTKLDNLPDISNDGDGTYVINQENGKQSLVTPNATDISYSNTSSGLTATKVQGAIDEVNTKVGTKANSSDVYTKSNTYNKTEVNSMLTLVKTATGNPCTFDTDLADNLVSLTAEIVATGGNGTPDNPNPINGYTEANITRCGVNLWDEEWLNGYYSPFIGNFVSDANYICSKNLIRVSPSTQYYIHSDNNILIEVLEYRIDGTFIRRLSSGSANETITTDNDCAYIHIGTHDSGVITTYTSGISINSPSTDTTYHPYNGQTYTIAFGQTVYGGVLDVTRGKLHVTHASKTFIGSEEENWDFPVSGSASAYCMKIAVPNKKSNTPAKANYLESIPPDVTWGNYDNFISYGIVTDDRNIYTGIRTITSVADWKTYLSSNPLTIVYELATPFDIDLTPVQISALVGTNNITSDLGGDVNVRYMAGGVASQVADIVKTELPDEHRYSTSEQVVGWWTDGRPIYEKILSYTFSADSTTLVIDTVYRTLAIIDISGFLLSSNNDDAILINGCADATSSSYVVFNGVTYDAIVIKRAYTDVCGSTPTAYVTVRYIKS